MLARKVDPTFGRDDLVVEQSLLAGVEERECPAREFVVVPHLRGARLERSADLGVDLLDILQSLDDAVLG